MAWTGTRLFSELLPASAELARRLLTTIQAQRRAQAAPELRLPQGQLRADDKQATAAQERGAL